MATSAGSITNIPHFIEAPSLEELQRGMLQLNAIFGAEHRYFDIQKDGKRWVAFYYQNAEVTRMKKNASTK